MISSAEKSLMQKIQAGDSSAFGELYTTHRRALLSYASKLTGSQDAEDLLNNALLKCWLIFKTDTFSIDCGFKTYVCRAIFTLFLDSRRYKKYTMIADAKDITEVQVAAREAKPIEYKIDLAAAMESLSAKHQEILRIRFYAGYNIKEAQKLLDVSAETVKCRQFYAVRSLRNKMQILPL